MYTLIDIFSKVNLVYFFAIYSFYGLLILLAFPALLRRVKELDFEEMEHLLKSESLPPITILAAMFNEAERVVESVHSFIRLRYPKKEIILVNDGSTDDTLLRLIDEFELVKIPLIHPQHLKTKPIRGVYRSQKVPDLVVIDKENGFRCDAMNAGLNMSTCPLFFTA